MTKNERNQTVSDIKAIRIKINVDKVDDAHLYPGKQGRYLNVALLPTHDNPYGDDFMVVQELDKAARDAGKKGPILGNGRIVRKGDGHGGHSGGDKCERRGEPVQAREQEIVRPDNVDMDADNFPF